MVMSPREYLLGGHSSEEHRDLIEVTLLRPSSAMGRDKPSPTDDMDRPVDWCVFLDRHGFQIHHIQRNADNRVTELVNGCCL